MCALSSYRQELNKYVPLKKLAPYRMDAPKLDARRRRHLREEVKAREVIAEAEMQALKAKKKRRSRKKKAAADAGAGSQDAGAGADDSNATADASVAPDALGQLAGGKRRRRKKGRKRQHAIEVAAEAFMDGQAEADLVPRVVPVTLPQESTGEHGHKGEEAIGSVVDGMTVSGTDSRRKKRKHQDSQSNREDERDKGKGSIGSDDGDRAEAGTEEPDSIRPARKKTRRGTSGKGRRKNAGEGGQSTRSKPKNTSSSRVAKLAKAAGVSKSRLASYGL